MEEIKERVAKVLQKVNIEEKRKRVREIEAESAKPTFWQNHQAAAVKMKELSALQKEIAERKKDTQAVQTTTELAQAVISSLSQFITTTREQTNTLMQIEVQETQTMQLMVDMFSDSQLQEKLTLARAANEKFTHLVTDLGAIPIQAETAFQNLQQLNTRLWEVIEILQTIIAQRTQPPLLS